MVPKDVLADLPAFVAVANRLSFRAAAEALGQTPAALSKAIGRLESRLGEPLLARTTRRVELTPAGAVLRSRAVEALNLIADGMAAAAGGPRLAGPVHVVAPAVLLPVIAARLATLPLAHPGLQLVLAVAPERAPPPAPPPQAVGLVLRLRPAGALVSADPGRTMVLGPVPLVTVAAPAYLGPRGLPGTTEDPARHRWLHAAPDPAALPEPARAHAALVTSDVWALMAAALAGAGLWRTIRPLVATALADGQLLAVPDRDDPAALTLTATPTFGTDVEAERAAGALALTAVAQALGLPVPGPVSVGGPGEGSGGAQGQPRGA